MEEINKTPAMERLYPTQHRAARGRDVCGRRQRLPLACGRCVEQGKWRSLFWRRCVSLSAAPAGADEAFRRSCQHI
jgi:hypothetical protein